MSYIHLQSTEATKWELDLFVIPPTQTSIESHALCKIFPTSSLTSTNTIEFVIPGSEDFVDMNSLLVGVELKVLKADGTNLDSTAAATGSPANTFENIFPSQYFLHALFSQVDILLGPTIITPPTGTYPYRSFFDTRFYTSQGAQSSFLRTSLWGERTARRDAIAGSKLVQLLGPLHADICQQKNLLLNHLPITIRLVRSSSAFALYRERTTTDVKVDLQTCYLYVTKYRLMPPVERGIHDALQTANAKYFLTRTEVKSFNVPTGHQFYSQEYVFTGQLPRKFIVGFVTSSAFTGNLDEHAFVFKHLDVNHIVAYVDNQMVPSYPYTPDFDKDLYAREYYSIFQELNFNHCDPRLNLSWAPYKELVAIYAFNLSPDRSDGAECGALSLQKRGTVRIEVKFKAALTKAHNMIVYAHFDSLIQISADRTVMTDY